MQFPSTLVDFQVHGTSREDIYRWGGSLGVFIDGGYASIEVSWQCYVMPQHIIDFHRSFQTNYESIIEAIGVVALRNIAPDYSIDDYVNNRTNVQDDMWFALDTQLREIWWWVPKG